VLISNVGMIEEYATSKPIFIFSYYMLHSVVNLVKYGVFILLVVVMFF
jgi:hypothetical protein